MSRWFQDLTRRGGRVHYDGIHPRTLAQLQLQLQSRFKRQLRARRRRLPVMMVVVTVLVLGMVAALGLAVGWLLGGR